MLAGELLRLDKRIAALSTSRAATREKLQALDRTLALTGQPDATTTVGVVRAHARYGTRGALTRFIASELRNALPAGLDTVEIARRCAARFAQDFDTPQARQRFQDVNVWQALRALRNNGLVAATRQAGPHGANLWRWVMPASSLADLTSGGAARLPSTTESD